MADDDRADTTDTARDERADLGEGLVDGLRIGGLDFVDDLLRVGRSCGRHGGCGDVGDEGGGGAGEGEE